MNRMVVHPDFYSTLRALNEEKIELPRFGQSSKLDFGGYSFPTSGKLQSVEELDKYRLDIRKGQKYSLTKTISGYDESFQKFQSLQGLAYLTSHSLAIISDKDYIPANYLTFNFYTRSQILLSKNRSFKDGREHLPNKSDEDDFFSFESAFKKDYAKDRGDFLLDATPNNSILLIDGPLIGAQLSHATFELNKRLMEKNIIPIHFVKNSSSNLVTDNIKELKGKFNSDMHWAYNLLNEQERTNFFKYEEGRNSGYSKIFCYMKPFKFRSPQRIEFHTDVYIALKDDLDLLLNLIGYLLIVHGDINNPQVRPIAIAEQFARDTLKLYDVHKMLVSSNLIASMNEIRFG
jgi:hypothetical protein